MVVQRASIFSLAQSDSDGPAQVLYIGYCRKLSLRWQSEHRFVKGDNRLPWEAVRFGLGGRKES